MIVTLEKMTGFKLLRIRVSGSVVRVKEDGKSETATPFETRDQALQHAEAIIARRTRNGAWAVLGRTDTDRYLRVLDRFDALRGEVAGWDELSKHDLFLTKMQPCRTSDLTALAEVLDGSEVPQDYAEFVATCNGLEVLAHFARDDLFARLSFQIPGCSTENVEGSFLLVGVSRSHAWNIAMLHQTSGEVETFICGEGEPELLDSHARFFDFFQYEFAELPQRLFDMKHRLCGNGPAG
jgi:hypothetical protein